jgi:glycosyltransferase involved in cell wall biosynthesis
MRIGMMTDNYKTHVSGVTNYISVIKHCLEHAGHEVYIFTFGKFGEVEDEDNIIYTPGLPITDFYINIHYNQRAEQLLSSMDIVHVHHPFISGTLAQRYCTPRNIPIVFTNHTRYDLFTQAYIPFLPKTIEGAILKAYLSRFYRACDLVIIPSESMHQVLVKQFGLDSPVILIPNGVDLTAFCGDSKPVARQIFGYANDDVVSVFVGRLAPEKNLSFLLQSFHDVAMTNLHVRLLLVGDGPERKKLETQAKRLDLGSKVIFTGIVPYSEVPRYLAASDLFITPSITESFGLSTVEAMATGLPVLGINSPGTVDLIEDGITGLISADDLAIFTAKFMLLSTHPDLRREMGKKAIQASKNYDIQTTTRILIQHYQTLVDAASRGNHGPRADITRLQDRPQ